MLLLLTGPSGTSGTAATAFWTTPGDPTGLYSPVGRVVVLVGLLAAFAVLLRWWWFNRRR